MNYLWEIHHYFPTFAAFASLREIFRFFWLRLCRARFFVVKFFSPSIALTSSSCLLYIVHMKSVNASEARKNWFRLLDEALRGEVIVVRRKGRRLVLRREELNDKKIGVKTRQYKKLLRVPKADEADRWSWEWKGPAGGLVARRRAAR
jgi:hypothetical protein